MVICVEISERTKQELDALMKVGNYHDYAEAVSMAISNQLVLNKQISKSKAVVLSGRSEQMETPAAMSRATPPVEKVEAPKRVSAAPTLFLALPMDKNPGIEPAQLPDDVFAPGQRVPADRWIFGQHNKLLPAKASCRALAWLLKEPENGSQGVLLSKAAAEISEQAVRLGDYLRFLDEKFEVNRDDAFSTAFPFSGAESEDKARLRYSNQFVASMSKQGRITGLLVDLKLINHARSKAPKILLTNAGWNFAALQNPILDSLPSENIPQKLSEEERSFLLDHIHEHVPTEDFAYRTILQAISDGQDTPEKLDAILRRHLSARSDRPFTDAFITTQRSGAISRMADLGLIDRVRDGIRVTYVVAQRGDKFMHKLAARVNHE